MKYRVGLVGLPNVGKSSIFNLLSQKAKSTVASFPYSTIYPIHSLVEIKNERLDELEELFLFLFRESLNKERLSKKYESFEFLDLAGIVPLDGELDQKKSDMGAAFLSHIRAVDVIVLVVRTFTDESVESQLNVFVDEHPELYSLLTHEKALKDIDREFKDKTSELLKCSDVGLVGRQTPSTLNNLDVLFFSERSSSLKREKKEEIISEEINNSRTSYNFSEPILELQLVLLTLIKSDLEIISKLLSKYVKDRKTFSKELSILPKIREELEERKFIPISMLSSFLSLPEEQKDFICKLGLLSTKKIVVLGNYGSSKSSISKLSELANWTEKYKFNFCSINLEAEEIYSLASTEEEKKEMRESVFLKNSSVNNLLDTIYKVLNLRTFYTFKLEDMKGRKYSLSNFSPNIEPVGGEIRAWFFKDNSSLGECVSQIHNELSDFFVSAHIAESKNFVRQFMTDNSNLNVLRTGSKNYKLKGEEIVQIISSA
ncbi:GTPase [Mycoplasma suis]|uniref:YchF subfamily translation-associated GTPase n=1 Tax=Mycoplasma suis (strain Illinois) TaxID=768700 RepID=F0QQ39_MYCSL|nr:GTPase [Mycoplasma suis]ADX97609.1 YchF subfamily translation-associated GTPase [Mycoplasma suis str. Illinois]